MPLLNPNGEKVLLDKDVVAELVLGATYFCNGDGSIPLSFYWQGTLLGKSNSFLVFKRFDNVEGGGPEREWIVRITEKRNIFIASTPTASEPRLITLGRLVFGDIISLDTVTNAKYIFKQKLADGRLILAPLDNAYEMSAAHEPALTRKYYKHGVFQLYNCGHSPSCSAPVVMYAGDLHFCATHRPRTIECNTCGRVLIAGQERYIENERHPLCVECHRLERERNQLIHAHSYKPVPVFIRDETQDTTESPDTPPIYAGIEQEVEMPDENESYDEEEDDEGNLIIHTPDENEPQYSRSNVAKILLKRFNGQRKWFYLKSDGSLSNGIELVTHPATFNAHRSVLPWKKLCDFYKAIGVRADDTDTAGLHIHVTKTHLPEAQRIKMGYFVNSQQAHMEKLAGRKATRWAQFKPGNLPIESYQRNTIDAKYEALNWSPSRTVEFRLFKGTVDYETLLSRIELTEAIVAFAKNVPTIEALRNHSNAWAMFLDFIKEQSGFKFLPKYLVAKGVADVRDMR